MDKLKCDVVIVGAGPAGLSCGIRLAQLAKEQGKSLEVFILEKGSEVGAHIISGAIFETAALTELIPNWQVTDAPLKTKVTEDAFYWLSKKTSYSLPVPPGLNNRGNYVISLGRLCRYLAAQAESLGVQILPGYSGKDFMLNDKGEVKGVITGEKGILKTGEQGGQYQPGIAIEANKVVVAEGAKGSLAQKAMEIFHLDKDCQPQTYGLGFKEVWRVSSQMHQPGRVVHTAGWPMNSSTYGGGFLYHGDDQKVMVGLIMGMDYKNPYLDPFREFQRYKHHPLIQRALDQGERLSYGARTINEGGYQAVPQCDFPGGVMIGCSAGLLNIAKIKGSHNAIRSGKLAAENIVKNLGAKEISVTNTFTSKLMQSGVIKELRSSRNIRPGFYRGNFFGVVNAAFTSYVSRGYEPWTIALKPDKNWDQHDQHQPIDYPAPDGVISFDRPTSVQLTNTNHAEDQPSHLVLKKPRLAIEHYYQLYRSPETRYCPAGVYEIVDVDHTKKLQINSQNCIHCKACSGGNIQWVLPEGGDGPRYVDM
ncbi:MAG TPA: electron transfer flavoprotein-ubiquinone oxidoreductase [Gammaproteobacteria bacterium]|nr:electron transfer flavoprotein-ubiquinone oxidoreductase [Gammaproteobacteria bacterium]